MLLAIDDLLPTLNGLVVHGLRREFGQFNAAHIRVGDVGEDRLRITGDRIRDRQTALPEPRDSLCGVLDMEAIVTKTGGPSGGYRVEFEKCVLTDLHVHQPRLPLVVIDPERFTVPHFLGVVRNRLSDIWHTDSNVIHHHDTTIGVLRRHYLHCQTREESGREKHYTTHTTS